MIVCNICGEIKERHLFSPYQIHADDISGTCRICCNIINKRLYHQKKIEELTKKLEDIKEKAKTISYCETSCSMGKFTSKKEIELIKYIEELSEIYKNSKRKSTLELLEKAKKDHRKIIEERMKRQRKIIAKLNIESS